MRPIASARVLRGQDGVIVVEGGDRGHQAHGTPQEFNSFPDVFGAQQHTNLDLGTFTHKPVADFLCDIELDK